MVVGLGKGGRVTSRSYSYNKHRMGLSRLVMCDNDLLQNTELM